MMGFRAEFDLDPQLIYLNSGTQSITPRSVLQAVRRHQAEYELNPTSELFAAWGRLWKVQCRLAQFFGARPSDLFLRQNVTAALNAFLLGAPLPTGRNEILTTDLEYGAVLNSCRFRAERDGLRLRVAPIWGVATEELVDKLFSAIGPETGMLVVSHVFTGNGLVLPLTELARRTRERGIILVVDGAHAPGALPLDFAALEDVDYYAGNLHKWMLGPKCTAFGWVAPRNQVGLETRDPGWTTYDRPTPFAEFGEPENRFALRFLMSGCHDFAPFLAISELLDFWERHQPQRIQAGLAERQVRLHQEMTRVTGWACHSPKPGPFCGPLLAYELPDPVANQGFAYMARLLVEEGVQVAVTQIRIGGITRDSLPPKWFLRLSPHLYNSDEEFQRAAQILKSFK